MADKPYIEASERSPFGEAHDFSPLENPENDVFHLPGYSDKRIERELAVRRGESPAPLEFRIQWVPVEKISGAPDRRKVRDYSTRGYKVMTPEDAKNLGLDLENSAAQIIDDTVRLEENMAVWAPREVAAKDNAKLNYLNQRQQEEVKERIEDAVEEFNVSAGLKAKAGGSEPIFDLERRTAD